MDTIDFFEKNNYLILKDALTKEQCDTLVKHMFKLYEDGKLIKDDQCPLSDAVYGDPIFDDILQRFAAPIGKQVGKQLLPTYTYARIYRPGEVLKKHKDRPACEISSTMTLGFDAKSIWPIFFDEDRRIPVALEVGEMAVYKGCDIVHWRPEFKGNWHVQVFFHYVDANGPHKDHAKDGRAEFGVQKNANIGGRYVNPIDQPINKEVVDLPKDLTIQRPLFNTIIIPNNDVTFPGYACLDSKTYPQLTFTKEECSKITSLVKEHYGADASVGNSENGKVAKNIRSAEIYVLENDQENAWIFNKVAHIVGFMNRLHFDYEISGITHGIQLIHYNTLDDVPGHYDWHIDAGPGDSATRKISFTAQLSDPNDYEGCELLINNHGGLITASKEQGSVHLFPSYVPHQVTPIKKGERFALVIWIHGSRRFR